MARVLVTVGMGRWPFDRLVVAARGLATDQSHEVFVQRGTSTIDPGCSQSDFLTPSQLHAQMAAADVIVTHGGNSVRLAQRLGKVPIAIGRRADLGEMGNDHQLRFLATEAVTGRVVVIDDPTAELASAVRGHSRAELRLLAERTAPPHPPCPRTLAAQLDRLHSDEAALLDHELNPFAEHPLRRYAWAWSRLHGRIGPHLDVGCGDGPFAGPLADAQRHRLVTGVDPHRDYLTRGAARHRALRLVAIGVDDRLPFRDESFASATALDCLEHVLDERQLLAEVHRILQPGALFVVTVPGRHVLSFLDPDNAKLRLPRLHRFVYRRRFGDDVYHRRFVDTSDGMIGDMTIGRHQHTNYRQRDLVELLGSCGFTPIEVDGANRWWRLFHTPALLGGPRTRAWCERRTFVDGRRHHEANLFCAALRR